MLPSLAYTSQAGGRRERYGSVFIELPDGRPAPSRYLNVATNLSKQIKPLAGQAEEDGFDFRPFRCHDLRQTHAIYWLQAGRDIYRFSCTWGIPASTSRIGLMPAG